MQGRRQIGDPSLFLPIEATAGRSKEFRRETHLLPNR